MFARDKLTYEPCPLPHRAAMTDAEMQAAAAAHFEAMQTRRSLRQFSPRPVPRAVIAECIRTAGRAPSGANHQPWHFVAVANPALKAQIRAAAEEEERHFYDGAAGDAWLRALEPIGTGWEKPHLEVAPWLIVVFAQRWGTLDDGTRYKNYYVPESTGIACGFLITALHLAGLYSLVHTPNPMKFLTPLLARPDEEKPVMILAVGHPAKDATVPAAAGIKKPLDEILTIRE
jgi:iodotyrosine deiodinase